jgi:hypothetical protein
MTWQPTAQIRVWQANTHTNLTTLFSDDERRKDATARIAREHGVEVIETVGNTEKKAGALNQVLAAGRPESVRRTRAIA